MPSKAKLVSVSNSSVYIYREGDSSYWRLASKLRKYNHIYHTIIQIKSDQGLVIILDQTKVLTRSCLHLNFQRKDNHKESSSELLGQVRSPISSGFVQGQNTLDWVIWDIISHAITAVNHSNIVISPEITSKKKHSPGTGFS